jgi:hypothetical protein
MGIGFTILFGLGVDVIELAVPTVVFTDEYGIRPNTNGSPSVKIVDFLTAGRFLKF